MIENKNDGIVELITKARAYVKVIAAALPIDPEADARVDKFMTDHNARLQNPRKIMKRFKAD